MRTSVEVCYGGGASFRLKPERGVLFYKEGGRMSDEFEESVKKVFAELKEFEKKVVDISAHYLSSVPAPEITFVLLQISTILVLRTCPERKRALEFIERSIKESISIYDQAVQSEEVDIEE